LSKKNAVFYNPFLPPTRECMDTDTLSSIGQNLPPEKSVIPHCSMKIAHGDLAASIVAKGQLALINGDLQEGLQCFDEALKLESNNPRIYYMQGLSLFEFGGKQGHRKVLQAAKKKFKRATTLDAEYFEAWQAWGSVLLELGLHFKEHHYFQEACKKVDRAIDLSFQQSPDDIADLYWELGVIFVHLAQFSGEALDLHQALNAFHKAHTLYEHLSADFWRDYSAACYQFALQINDLHFYSKALSCLKNALHLSPRSYDNWHLCARIFQSLYFHTHDEEHFAKANDSYAAATQLQPNNASFWLDWAEFLCLSSRKMIDSKRLQACIEKCHRAFACDPDNLPIQAIWAEALALLGNETEKLDLIYEAQNRIAQVIEKTEHVPAVLYAYGIVLKALGHYFNDFDYYFEAIEKFQAGLSIDRTCHAHWHAIGSLYVVLGDLGGESEDMERSLRFYQKAIDLHPSSFYIVDYATALYKLGEMTHEQQWVEEANFQFERALGMQRNALYLHPDWLFHYACSLDVLGDFHEEDTFYLRAIEIFSHVLMIDPDLYAAHHRLALTLSHLGELTGESDYFHRAIRHLHICLRQDKENDCIVLDYATVLINIAQHASDTSEAAQLHLDAENQLWNALRLGNVQGYYHLACLYSLLGQNEKALSCLYRAAHFDILPSIDEMLQDEWLDNLRATGEFIAFLSQLEQRGNLPEDRPLA